LCSKLNDMEKKTTHHEFKEPNVTIWLGSKLGKFYEVDVQNLFDGKDYNNDTSVSSDIKKFCNKPLNEFGEFLYEFCINYNERLKKFIMKVSEIFIDVKNGEGKVSFYSISETYSGKKIGSFNIKKEDMLKFLNNYSKLKIK